MVFTKTFKKFKKNIKFLISNLNRKKAEYNILLKNIDKVYLIYNFNTAYFHNPTTHEKYYPQIPHYPQCDIT